MREASARSTVHRFSSGTVPTSLQREAPFGTGTGPCTGTGPAHPSALTSRRPAGRRSPRAGPRPAAAAAKAAAARPPCGAGPAPVPARRRTTLPGRHRGPRWHRALPLAGLATDNGGGHALKGPSGKVEPTASRGAECDRHRAPPGAPKAAAAT